MSLQVPIRLRIEQGGVLKGYVETLNFGTVTVQGPVAHVPSGGGPGGGDADTLQGHPASDFTLEVDFLALEAEVNDRSTMWSKLGIAVSALPPASGITYSQWLAGVSGHWGWILLP